MFVNVVAIRVPLPFLLGMEFCSTGSSFRALTLGLIPFPIQGIHPWHEKICLMLLGRGRVTEREGDTESEAGSRLRAVSTEPDARLNLTDREIMT